jgi:hypothetical protein
MMVDFYIKFFLGNEETNGAEQAGLVLGNVIEFVQRSPVNLTTGVFFSQ